MRQLVFYKKIANPKRLEEAKRELELMLKPNNGSDVVVNSEKQRVEVYKTDLNN